MRNDEREPERASSAPVLLLLRDDLLQALVNWMKYQDETESAYSTASSAGLRADAPSAYAR
jgi:hypothetical protein